MSEHPARSLALVICHREPSTAADHLRPAPQWPPLDGWSEVVVVGGPELPAGAEQPAKPYPDSDPNSKPDSRPGSHSGLGGDGPTPGRAPGRAPGRPRRVDSWHETEADHLVFLPGDHMVTAEAFRVIDDLLCHNPTVDFAYFDSTGFSPSEPFRLTEPRHRPGFSPDRLRAQMYLGEMFLVSRVVAEAVASGDGPGSEVSAPLSHATAMALTGASGSIAHVPQVLYRFPVDGEPAAPDTVVDHHREPDLAGLPATCRPSSRAAGVIRLEPELTDFPPVSIVMPTNGSQRLIDSRPTVLCLQAIDSVIAMTDYPDYELVLVITPGAATDLAAQVISTIDSHPPDRQPTVRFCRDDRPFNFSNACNRGAVTGAGDMLVFLNDDTVVDTRDWLDRLVMYGSRPEIGAVGARLHYGNGRIQHAGIWTRGGHPSHRYERFPVDHPGYLDSLSVPQNCLAVTGACLAVSAEKFRQVGGFSPEFPSSYNDVDLCLKLDDLGYRTVVDPDVVLTHFEASSRDPKIDDWELALLHERWRSVITDDPYDNPHHLAPQSEEYPAPDPMVTEQKRLAGWIDFLPRVWPRPRLTAEPYEETAGTPC